ncbi:MAG: FAD-binding oxidoreductase [Candidatus Kapabacteria bacterium]|nr:FAD-binding oxidoreductase [Candidatus Kapabacteria bacterium]
MHTTLSFWEQTELLRCDALVVGGGIIGLSAAITLKEQDPHRDVVLLEREILPSGASTKNAGFACYGSLTEVLGDVDELGATDAQHVIARRKHGLDMLRGRLGDERMGYEPCGGYELLWETDAPALARMDEANALMEPLFGAEYYSHRDPLITEFGFNLDRVRNLVMMKHEGAINSGRMMKNLALYAAHLGVRIITGADVQAVEENETDVRIRVRRHVMNDTVEFVCRDVIVCTNALAPQLMPGCDVLPARGQVLITEPIPSLQFKGVFHFHSGYYYFRHVGNRVLFGGGRNLDKDGETTDRFETTPLIQESLLEHLRNTILPGRDVQIAMRWAGIMGFSSTKKPIVQRISRGIVVGFGCNGMGVALGSSIGAEAAELAG